MQLLNLHLYITKYICNYMQNDVLYLNVYFKAALVCVTLSTEIKSWISNIQAGLAFAVHKVTTKKR